MSSSSGTKSLPGVSGHGVDSSGVSGGSSDVGSLGNSSDVEELSESSLVPGSVDSAVSSDALQVKLVGLAEPSLVSQVVGSAGSPVDLDELGSGLSPSSEGKHLDSSVLLLSSDNGLSPFSVSTLAESSMDVVGSSPFLSPLGHGQSMGSLVSDDELSSSVKVHSSVSVVVDLVFVVELVPSLLPFSSLDGDSSSALSGGKTSVGGGLGKA